jgi:hypothetical protein
VYCAWLAPEEMYSSTFSNDINACCIVLYVITERWPAAKKYRDAFERVKQAVIDPLDDNRNHQPRRAITKLSSVGMPSDDGSRDYDSIINQMSGHFGSGTPSLIRDVHVNIEQVQYQMGVVPPLQSEPADDIHTLAPIGAVYESGTEMNDELGMIDAYSGRGSGSQGQLDWQRLVTATQGSTGLTPNADAFDLQGYSVDMGWMAEAFGSSSLRYAI